MRILQEIFTAVLGMSLTASIAAIGVILVRMLLRKTPKIFSYILWSVVLFRLICPFSFTSELSILNLVNIGQSTNAAEYEPHNIDFAQIPGMQTGIHNAAKTINAPLPQSVPAEGVNPANTVMAILSFIWIAGVIALLVHSSVSYLKFKQKLNTATLVSDNIFETDAIGTAFVYSLIRPKIYIPSGVNDADLTYILEHERTHIRRGDYIIKPLAFIVLILHWFNPLMWLSFALMSRDMEMSCDESVLNILGNGAKKGYSTSLLSMSVENTALLKATPLAFGENHVKSRIKNILNYKKPGFWVLILAVAAVGITIAIFATNPKYEHTAPASYSGYSIDTLMKNKTPYVGNNSKVVGLIDAMPLPEGIVRSTIELQTTTQPYEITINFDMNDASDIETGNTINDDAFYRNSIVLFSLIDNVDIINCYIADNTSKNDAASYSFTYTRKDVENLMGDVRRYADNEYTIKTLVDRINSMPANPTEHAGSTSTIGDSTPTSDMRHEVKLPDFKYEGSSPIEKLVYATEIEKYSEPQRGFTIVAPKIFGSYYEGDRMKVFVTTYSATYKLYDNVLDEINGGIIPSAITYKKDKNGNYTLDEYKQAMDGSKFAPSIKQFCTMPVSGKKIPGLADKIIDHSSNDDDIINLQWENLYKHLKANGIKDATLTYPSGEIKFSMSSYRP